jgi:hypothetical protein
MNKTRNKEDNGEWVVLTFGCSPWMFYLDLVAERSIELASPINHDLLDSVFPVTRAWTPFRQQN